jgi:two-component system nitrate/nitrite response regulator NarL
MTGITKTVVVDRNPIFREGLVRILSDASSMSCTGFGSLEEIGKAAGATWTRALFLIDLGEDRTVVTHGIGYLRERFPECMVVVLSERYSHGHMVSSLRAGACGYLLKHTSCEALVKSLELVSLGECVFPAQARQLICSEESLEAPAKQVISQYSSILSAREVEVLACLSQGKSNKIIARQWGISEATVKVHVKAILRKIQAKNRTEAALWARDHGVGVNGNRGLSQAANAN